MRNFWFRLRKDTDCETQPQPIFSVSPREFFRLTASRSRRLCLCDSRLRLAVKRGNRSGHAGLQIYENHDPMSRITHCSALATQTTAINHSNATSGCDTFQSRPRTILTQHQGICSAHIIASINPAGFARAASPKRPRTKFAKLVVMPQLGQEMLNIDWNVQGGNPSR